MLDRYKEQLVILEVVGTCNQIVYPDNPKPHTQYIIGYRCCICDKPAPKKDMYEHLVVEHKIPPSIVMFALDISHTNTTKPVNGNEEGLVK